MYRTPPFYGNWPNDTIGMGTKKKQKKKKKGEKFFKKKKKKKRNKTNGFFAYEEKYCNFSMGIQVSLLGRKII